MNGIKIKGTGRAVPAHIVTNTDLTRRVDTDEEWIRSRTGIERRRHITTESHLELCCAAARQALDHAGISPKEVGACIVATLTADDLVPSAACAVQRELSLPDDSICFDLNAACTGFLFAMHTMECLLNASPRKYGLVIGAECLSRIINWEDRSTCILFGDGAGAAVLESAPEYPSLYAVTGCHGNDTLLHVGGVGPGKRSQLSMQGAAVFKFAVEAVPYCMEQVLQRAGKTIADVDFFVFHQANARIIDRVVRKYRIPAEKYYKNISEYGNTSAASIPLVLSELWDLGKVRSGSRVLIVGFGGGLTWGGALAEFA